MNILVKYLIIAALLCRFSLFLTVNANWHWIFYALSLKLSPSLHVNDYRRDNCNNRFLSVLSVMSVWCCELTITENSDVTWQHQQVSNTRDKRNKTQRKWAEAGDICKVCDEFQTFWSSMYEQEKYNRNPVLLIHSHLHCIAIVYLLFT